ncbi:hypothetical protein BH23BAC2_BH23BAC2_00840 [soil metagenome]
MFTTGQLIFAVLFLIAFIITIIYSYRKDIALHKKYYSGSIYVLIGFIVFILLLFAFKSVLNN